MAPKPTYLIVDTNCFLRLLDGGPRPLVGQTVANFRLVTTDRLVAEAKSPELKDKYPKLESPDIQRELKTAALRFSPKEKTTLRENTEEFRAQANLLVAAHCLAQDTFPRVLSFVDASLWTVAVHMKGALATDEWPLTMAAERIPFDDDGTCLKVYSSIHILHMLEMEGKLDPKERWNVMLQWRRENEALHRDADKQYTQLFGEPPPNVKSSRR